jgi:hypothetical protein
LSRGLGPTAKACEAMGQIIEKATRVDVVFIVKSILLFYESVRVMLTSFCASMDGSMGRQLW